MTHVIAPELLAELDRAEARKQLQPPRCSRPRYPVWQCAHGQHRRTFLRSRCGRPRRLEA